MSKTNPKNRQEAFTHQFEDDVKQLLAFSQLIDDKGNNKESFEFGLKNLKAHINTYEMLENVDTHKKLKE